MSVYSGLAKIKGISWAFSNAVCHQLNIDKRRKIGSLTEEEIKKIAEFVKNPTAPIYIVNRQRDRETGVNRHVTGTDLELAKEFDIKRLRQIKNLRGLRHALGLPLRGQRTKGNFRRHRAKGVGIKKKNKK